MSSGSGAGGTGGGLAVLVDGTALPEEEARALWKKFSDWMEDHRGDLAGFAKSEGFASVHPGVDNGRPVLHASRTDAQRPYGPVTGSGGSGGRHKAPRPNRSDRRKSKK